VIKWQYSGALALVFAVLLIGIRSSDGQVSKSDGAQLEANKQIVRHLFETVWNDTDFVRVEEMWGQDVLFHFRGSTDSLGPEGVQAMVESHHAAFPDFRFVVEDIIAEGDRVAARVRFFGSHTGEEWFGLPATGKEIDVTEMMFFRFQNGRVVEAWEDYDGYVMRRQLGALP
jgi:steroid delta-isomerase-like uncharacterized protein